MRCGAPLFTKLRDFILEIMVEIRCAICFASAVPSSERSDMLTAKNHFLIVDQDCIDYYHTHFLRLTLSFIEWGLYRVLKASLKVNYVDTVIF